MAQFIQSNRLSEIPGSAGDQSPLPSRGAATAKLINQIGGTLETAGKMYADSKAKDLVNEEIQAMETALSFAEQQSASEEGISLAPPEEVDYGQDEWNLLSGAVASGQLPRETARLIASSRLRTRISEQPFFADRMRQAASGVLGFNIESEHARQYFASFTPSSQLGGGENKYRQDKMNQAQAISEATGYSVETVYKQLVQADYATERKKGAAAQMELGTIDAQEFTSEFLLENHKTAFGALFGEMKAIEAQTGQPVDGIAFSRIVRENEQAAIEEFNNLWVQGGGTLNTPEHQRAVSSIQEQYSEMEEFAKDFGVDNLTTIQIERAEQARQIYGDRFFPQMKLIIDTYGQQVASDLINIAAMNPAKRDLLMTQSPELRQAFELMNSDPAEFSRKLTSVATKIVGGEELTSEDEPFVDAVVVELHGDGSQDTKKSVIEGLAASGATWKSLSILSETSPQLEPEENVEYYSKMYERDLPLVINKLGTLLADAGANNYDFVVEEDGTLRLNPITSQGANRPRGDIEAEIARINVFARGYKKGWGRVISDSLEDYKAKLNSQLQQAVTDARDTLISSKEQDLLGNIESGNMRVAGRLYGELREESPELYDMTFNDFLSEMRVRAGGEATEFVPTDAEMRRMQEESQSLDISPEEARQQLEQEVSQYSGDVNRFGEPAVELVEGSDGTVEVRTLRPLSLPQGKLRELRRLAERANSRRQ